MIWPPQLDRRPLRGGRQSWDPSVGYRADLGCRVWNSSRSGGLRVSDFLLYGINATGEAVFSEMLCGCDRASLHELAGQKLQDWHAVEIWEGPMCVLRLQRTGLD